jgi:hypothetical protein
MGLNRRAAKRDANEVLIVKVLREVGATVEFLSGRKGLPDLLVGFAGQTFLMETKQRKGTLTPDQIKWHGAWRGQPVYVVRRPEDALRALGFEVQEGGSGVN